MRIIVEKDNNQIFQLEVSNEDLLLGNDLYIGREEDCHIVLDTPQVSRHHASISLEGDNLLIKSLSENASLKINGVVGTSGHISDKSVVEVLNYTLLFDDIPKVIIDIDKENEEVLEKLIIQDDIAPIEDFVEEETEIIAESDKKTFGLDENDLSGYDEPSEDEDLNVDEKTEVIAESEREEKVDEGCDVLADGDFKPETEENDDDFDIEAEFAEEQVNFEDDQFAGDDVFSENDSGFNEDSGFSNDSESTQLVQTFAKFSLKLFGEYAPFDRFLINDNEVFIGRDPEKCQIVLDDPEVSKVHAVIKRTMLNYTLEDLDSANGIILNGERVNKSELSNGDEFLIGDTTLTVTISSDIIEAEKDILMPVADNQEVEIEEIVEEEVGFDDFSEEEVVEKSLIKRILKDPKKKRLTIIVAVILFIVFVLPDEKSSLEGDGSDGKNKKEVIKKDVKNKKVFNAETMERLEANYSLAVANFKKGELSEAKEYLDIVMSADPTYKDSQTMSKLIQEGLDKEVRLKEREQTEAERRERQLKIATLLEKARMAVEKRDVEVAKSYFNLIFELDPENIDVPPLKLELEAYVEDKRRKEQEIALKKASRQNKVNQLAPAKTLYLKGDWFKSVDALEKFLLIKDMDEDLVTDATDMLKDSRVKLSQIINPLVSKARSYKEGQDLKQAYEIYGDVLKYDPTNEEALNERDNIFVTLKNRSRKIYREALVAESLSLYAKAKEKFQEVQQVSPINSEYYNKATIKLKSYLE